MPESSAQPEPESVAPASRSGGVDLHGDVADVGGDIIGRDKVVINVYGSASPARAAPSVETARIFISYKRNATPDEQLALSLYRALGERGHRPFIDQAMAIGVDWAKEIQRLVESADFFVVLLSAASANSEMVAQEIDFAHRHRAVHGNPNILPVRVAFTDDLPYQLSQYLDRLQYARWRSQADTDALIAALLKAIESAEALPDSGSPLARGGPAEVSDDGHVTETATPAPLPTFDPRTLLEAPSGAVKLKSQLYIERDADEDLRRQVLGAGTTTTIRAPRQMGKTSLLVRGVQEARKAGHPVVYVDLQRVSENYLASLDGLLRYLADEIAQRLSLDAAFVERAWTSSRGPQDKLNAFLERHVLPVADKPILLAMDEADRLLEMPYKTDFFGLLRAWDSSRAYDEQWENLNIALVISTHPHLLITDVSQSPFNVGLRIQLSDFAPDQIAELNRRHGSPVPDSDLPRLLERLGGHPYLTRQALYTLVDEKLTWAELARRAPADDGPFGSHLRSYLWQLSQRPELIKGIQEVLARERCSDETVLYRLNAAGMVKEVGDRVKPRCGLYADYFGAKLK